MPSIKTIHADFIITGGGVAGLAMGIALQQLGLDFLIIEKTKVLKGIGAGFGLAANAMRALDILGLKDEVEELGYYLEHFNILDQHGSILVEPNTQAISAQYQQKNFAIHRADLHQYLQSKLKSGQLLLAQPILKVQQNDQQVTLWSESGQQFTCNYLLACDGIHSPIRQSLVPKSTARYAGYTCWRATIDNTALQITQAKEIWGPNGRFGLTPLKNQRIYWYACLNAPFADPEKKAFGVKELKAQFADYPKEVVAVLAHTNDQELIWNDILDIKPLAHFAYNRIVLLGDAAHATTPNMGQGACQALEDVVVLQQELKNTPSVEQAFIHFEQRRLSRTRYICKTSERIGRIAQWENPLLVFCRNQLLRLFPTLGAKSIDKLLRSDFMNITL